MKSIFLALVLFSVGASAELKMTETLRRVETFSIKTVEVPLSAANCALSFRGNPAGYSYARVWAGDCKVDLREVFRLLNEQGYSFGDVRYRNMGGDFKLQGVSTHASGWEFEKEAMAVEIFVPLAQIADRESAVKLISDLLNQGQLKLKMSFNKKTCVINGRDVSGDRSQCVD